MSDRRWINGERERPSAASPPTADGFMFDMLLQIGQEPR